MLQFHNLPYYNSLQSYSNIFILTTLQDNGTYMELRSKTQQHPI